MIFRGTVDFGSIKRELDALGSSKARTVKAAVMQEVGAGIVTNIRRSAPKDTGQYSRSWRMTRKDHTHVIVKTDEPKLYRLLEITGSQPHIIRARRARFLHWCSPDGGSFFRVQVRHPGFSPIPHVGPSVRHVVRQAPYLFFKHLSIQFKYAGPGAAKYRRYTVSVRRTVKKKSQGYKCSAPGPRPDSPGSGL